MRTSGAGSGDLWPLACVSSGVEVEVELSLWEPGGAMPSGTVGIPRWPKIFATTSGCSMTAVTFIRPPHLAHARMSIWKTRFKSDAPSMREVLSLVSC